ncbi:glycosyl transferase family 90 [Aminobacter sp. HY435]|uniref:glycosyl transferase family 90 n=1 Tax=Aminobacter sp. HY435 TaxID=2970917 RepID=UPI0022B96F7B|nr:glycosyl transferase family 90 [Aminobacter sp. HY435]
MPQSISLASSRFFNALKVARYIRREFVRAGEKPPKVRVRYVKAGNPPYDLRIERTGDRLTLVLEDEGIGRFTRSMRLVASANAFWLSQCAPQVKHMTVNASDGETTSNARFAPSVRFPRHIGLPDPHFFQSHGFGTEMQSGRSAPRWRDRSDEIVWRGGMNGNGWISLCPEDQDDAAVLQRLRMVMRLKEIPGTDVRFSGIHPSAAAFRPLAQRQGLLEAPIAAPSWLGRKFAIDIDGYTNTWSNLLVRMLYGCCVLKVDSQFGFRQWYYDELKPFEHYVPVAADMADFAEKIEWVRSHGTEAEAIAARGQALARTLTFSSQTRRAAELIEQHWDHLDSLAT